MKISTLIVILVYCGQCLGCAPDLSCSECLNQGCEYGKVKDGFVCVRKILPQHKEKIMYQMDDCKGMT